MGFFKNLFGRKNKEKEINKEELKEEKLAQENSKEKEISGESDIQLLKEHLEKVQEIEKESPEPVDISSKKESLGEKLEQELEEEKEASEEVTKKEVTNIKDELNKVMEKQLETAENNLSESIETKEEIIGEEKELSEESEKKEKTLEEEHFAPKEERIKEIDEVKEAKKINNEEVKKESENLEPIKEKKGGFFSNLKEKLFRSRTGLFGTLKKLITGRSVIDDEMYEELEEVLIQSDIGYEMTNKIVQELSKEVKKQGIKDPKETYDVLKKVMEGFLITEGTAIDIEKGRLNVILVVGVNGVGKTTTIGKLASKYTKEGKKVILGAADTFRAAAIEQLVEWGKRAGVEVVSTKQGGDPGAVVFDALDLAEKNKADILIIDTAGRLHNKNNLMKELEKINNIIKRKIGVNPYETILIIDGTTGQNAISQAKEFNEVTDLTGFIITKLDGTAKGGIVFSVSELIKKPIKFIGVGEKIEDLKEFNVKEYIDAIFD